MSDGSISVDCQSENNKPRILIYGDSNTWGHNPTNFKRFSENVRWPGVMKQELKSKGMEPSVFEEALNGRTTIFDDRNCVWLPPNYPNYCNGRVHLPVAAHSTKPLDIIILALGANDCKRYFNASAKMIATGMGLLVDDLRLMELGFDNNSPEIIIVAPPKLRDVNRALHSQWSLDESSYKVSAELGSCYKELAKEKDVFFVNTEDATQAGDDDGLHLSSEGHSLLGKSMAEKVIEVLRCRKSKL